MVIPVHSSVDPVLDPVDKDFKPANERDAYIQSLCMFISQLNVLCLHVRLKVSPEEYEGAPITVQLVCRRFREEECIGLGGVVTDALKTSRT